MKPNSFLNKKRKISMIQVGTQILVTDNSGGRKIKCIKISGKIRTASIGDQVITSIKNTIAKQKSKISKGKIYKALVIETAKGIMRKDGSSLRFFQNSAILLSPQGSPLGSRIVGVLTYELRSRNYSKVLSLSSVVL
jgi:large subunit ribosomal protein L14